MSAKQALRRLRAPDELGAERRAWEVVRSAYGERLPAARRRSYGRPVGALIAGLLVVGTLALSPAGATVGRLISHALGVRHAAPALSSLPSAGQLLVTGTGGTWTVAADGSTRRVSTWPQASWSPHGLYLGIARGDRLAAVNSRGITQWTLTRAAVADPRWYPPTAYRVAYRSHDGLHVVAGDGTGDHLLARPVAPVAPAWRPGHPYELAYVDAGGRIVMSDTDTGRTLWSAAAKPRVGIRELGWSSDGNRLLAVSANAVFVYGGDGRRRVARAFGAIVDGALSPDGGRVALVLGGAGGAAVVVGSDGRVGADRRVLAGTGLGQVAWSPDGRWLLVTWPAANQWVFVRVVGPPRIAAVSRIAQQFAGGAERAFPRVDGWCCNPAGVAG